MINLLDMESEYIFYGFPVYWVDDHNNIIAIRFTNEEDLEASSLPCEGLLLS